MKTDNYTVLSLLGSRDGWTAVFCLVAAFNIIGGFIFVIFAQGEVQDWAKSDYNSLDSVVVEDTQGAGQTDQKVVEISVTESSAQVNPLEPQEGPHQDQKTSRCKPLREVKSVPASMRRGSRMAKEKVGRRATMDVGYVGSLIKRVQSQAFSNLAMADL
ncbi:hypothetical protein Btru_027297 [Bulinus truncatus]|nr:hypothetical protein Btru_027297 [Bulinus truncatus]